jgi:hypothetical protein
VFGCNHKKEDILSQIKYKTLAVII